MRQTFDIKIARRDLLVGSLASVSTWPLVAPSIALAQADMQPSQPPAAAAEEPPPSAAAAREAVGKLEDAILRISREVWATPELSLHEELSSKIHIRELEAAGFDIVSTGTSGIPTAFVAEWSQGSGGPTVGFLPEYDALPSLGNAAEPRQTPGPTGA